MEKLGLVPELKRASRRRARRQQAGRVAPEPAGKLAEARLHCRSISRTFHKSEGTAKFSCCFLQKPFGVFFPRLRPFTRKPDRNHLFEYFLEIEVCCQVRFSAPWAKRVFILVSSRKILELVPQLHRLYVGALSELPLWDDEMKVKHVKKSTKIFAKILVDIFF